MREHARLQTAALLRRLAFQLNRIARSSDADAVHDLRVAIRRLSRCLRVFSSFYPGDSWKKARQELKALMNEAAEVRERDVALLLFTEAGVGQRAPITTRIAAERREAARTLRLAARHWKSRNFSRKWRSRLDL
jgi:CHAD domain-containing protein